MEVEKLMTGLSQEDRNRMTVRQQKRLAETRDCPHCSGTLDRRDVSKQDTHVIEKYDHIGGAGTDCPGHKPSNGLLESSGTWVEHWVDGNSVGAGALEGMFQ